MGYPDLRTYLSALTERGLLHRIQREVDKDWEIAAVTRRAFQRVGPGRRTALMFENITGFSAPLVVGVLGASPRVYAAALQCEPDEIVDVWARAQDHPTAPRLVDHGPVKENILRGAAADFTRFPNPTWTVGQDPGPYVTSPFMITVDPDTGQRNVGTYRLQVKGPRKLGINIGANQHAQVHLDKYHARNEPMPVAIIIGCDPTIGLTSVSKFSPDVDELALAGGLRGEPLELVRGETVPLDIPATAEIVVEGWIPPGVLEPEGPFGEYTGFILPSGEHPIVEISAILHRNSPIYQAFMSQMPPSESSCIRGLGREKPMLRFLRDTVGLPVLDVHMAEESGSSPWVVVSVTDTREAVVSTVASAARAYGPNYGKFLVIVDADIDVRNAAQVQWAISWMVRPDQDIHISSPTPAEHLDPSTVPMGTPDDDPRRRISAKVCIDATRKHAYPPLAIPPQEHLDRVDARWASYGFSE